MDKWIKRYKLFKKRKEKGSKNHQRRKKNNTSIYILNRKSTFI